MAVNKVVYGSRVLIDISDAQVAAGDVSVGKIFYQADGTKTTGTLVGQTITVGDAATVDDETLIINEGGGGSIFQTKTVTPTESTQTVTPDSGYDALSSVTVNPIPSNYIIPTGTKEITENGTGIDVSNFALADVDVSNWTFLGSKEITTATTSTSAASAGTIACGSAASTKAKIIYVQVRDKAGPRAGYFVGSDAFFINTYRGNGATTTFATPAVVCHRYTTSSAYGITAGQYGVYGYSINSSGTVTIRQRYNSSYSLTIDGTYEVKVYSLEYPDGVSVFDI